MIYATFSPNNCPLIFISTMPHKKWIDWQFICRQQKRKRQATAAVTHQHNKWLVASKVWQEKIHVCVYLTKTKTKTKYLKISQTVTKKQQQQLATQHLWLEKTGKGAPHSTNNTNGGTAAKFTYVCVCTFISQHIIAHTPRTPRTVQLSVYNRRQRLTNVACRPPTTTDGTIFYLPQHAGRSFESNLWFLTLRRWKKQQI